MKSMTGYALVREQTDLPIIMEMKSFNSRYLEVNITLPTFLGFLEPFLYTLISKKSIRGKVDIVVKAYPSPKDVNFKIDRNLVMIYVKELKDLYQELNIPFNVDMDFILKQPGIVKQELDIDVEVWKNALLRVFNKCFNEYDDGKLTEGKVLLNDIKMHVDTIKKELKKIKNYSFQMDEFFKEIVKKRFIELLGEDIDDRRPLQEVAALLVKFTINEEIVRLESHIELLDFELSKEGAVGKRLDFICQELMREINTIGSKNQMKEITPSVIAIKTAVEDIREQIKNVE